MDANQFEALAARISGHLTRRQSVGVLGVLGAASLGLADEVTARKKKKKGKGKGKKPKGSSTQPPTPPSTTPGPQRAYVCFGESYALAGDIPGSRRTAQTFTPERSGSLQRVSFSIGKPSGSTGDYVVQLLLVIGNTPSHLPQDVLAEVIVPNSEVPEGNDSAVSAIFTNGPQVTVGTQYAVAISRLGAGTYDRAFSAALNCGGRMFVAEQGQPFVAQGAQDDAIVRVFVA